MDKNEKKYVYNPRRDANPISALTFKWLFGTLLTGFKRELEISDLYSPLDEHSSRLLGNKMSKLWEQEQKRCEKLKKESTPSLLRILVRAFGCDILVFGFFLAFLEFVVKITQPIILANLLKYFKGTHDIDQTEAFYWGTGIVIGIFLDCAISHPAVQGLMHMGMKIRVACCSLIYRKILKVSKVAAQGDISIGQMINLLSNDVNRLDYSVISLHYIWMSPIQAAIISYLLYREVDLAAIGGIVTLLLFIPIHGCYGKLSSYFTKRFAFKTDERLRLTNQIISGVKVIKMYAWEKPFSFLVDKAREKEVKINRNNSMLTEICWSFENYIPRLCLFITILGYVLLGNDINAEKVYLVTAYYNVLRTSLYRFFPLSIKEIAEALVSIRRLQKFLLFEEVDQDALNLHSDSVKLESKTGIASSFQNVTAKWNHDTKSEALRNVTFDIKSGSLTTIVGQVGSGKTTILHTMLKEIPISKGILRVNGKVSYASQEPWLFASSIKQNILFGKPMDIERYKKVIEVCQLKRDFQLLPYGDSTLVGEKGINLSGGQCARVNLARAVYHDADIYLLDDPLSAVDTHVGKGIFENCIKTFLREKTVVLVTHQLHFLKHVDHIIIIEDGTIQAEGDYNNLINSGLDLTKLMQLHSGSDEVNDNELTSTKENDEVIESKTSKEVEEEELSESRTLGNISIKTYYHYFKAARNGFLVFMVFVISIICQVTSTGADYFISDWVNQEDENKINFTTASEDDLFRGRGWYVYNYGFLNIATVIVSLAQAYIFFNMCMRISRNLHAMMFNSLTRTTMSFFNSNPIGRIMNRFSKDMGIIDTRLPQTVMDVTQIGLYTFAVIGIVINVNYWFIIPIIIITIVAFYFRQFYIRTSRSVKRLEGITRSPVFNHLSDSVYGLTTIRALNAQDILTKEFDSHQDLHSSAWFIFFSAARTFGMYTEFLCLIFTGVIIYTITWLGNGTLAGDVGLVITQCILLTGMLQWGVRQTAELENQMTSVERVLEYSKLPEEPKLERTPQTKAPENWPSDGKIVFSDVTLTYNEKPALRDLNFIVEPKQMIGIVGRTGAGKSSLINALFRLANIEGEIFIDNVATSEICLQDLRSKISIIPQEPVLFAGTLRRNLDPFEEYTDHDLWQALEDVELKAFLESDLGLNMRVSEGGTNFSIGQRQLLCLARAIVRNNKILVLDEATANVDAHTDALIQDAIRKKFKTCTVLVIAHRLNTVMDSDKILVMDASRVVEYDHSYQLLQRKNGVFYNMVQQTGAVTASNLFEMAKSSFEKLEKRQKYILPED